ncbi:Polysaccharide deacetylase [Mesobacillus persicus]|uniref:Polysaccharide deacetylase n=1 Tax=Mesobacillus persicus TaxID=930146 RepID=A0A1H7VST5_9BACI|nr:polysaccharide deacetylase family protein [Mesobacillus persicus]SEM12422.1 Polysaccharide deacetylase [Mesobacillus persicus]
MLTFDDGPSRVLPEILDILEEEKVPATFFWQSRLLHNQRPWQRVLAGGHQIGTHSCKHRDLSKLNYEGQYRDLAHSVAKIESIIGNKVTYFRPPFGQYNDDTIEAARALNLVPVLWKIASMDWELKDSPEQIITNVINHLEDGSIILLHELHQTLDILPELIQEIKDRGYHFTNL